MKFRTRFTSSLAVAATLSAAGLALTMSPWMAQAQQGSALQKLHEGFLNPPDNARPMVRWWWFGPAVTKPELLRELQQMKADGIGGAEMAFVYPEVLDGPNPEGIGTGNGHDTFKNLPFLSPEMLDAVNYAQSEGRKLGLRIDVTLCSGWPYGGPNTTIEEAATRLITKVVNIPSGATSIEIPRLGEGESLIAAFFGSAADQKSDGAKMKPLELHPADGKIAVPPDTQGMVVEFFILGHTKQQVKRAAVGAEGYVLDPFSHQAVKTHLDKVGEPLVKAFGATPPYAIFSDSLEAYGADWTPSLPAEFKKRRGYDLIPHLPELVAGGTPEADKVRHDWGVTLTELVNENYLTQINDWAKAHGTKFRSQTYGEPAVSLSSQRLVALPEGEGPQWRAFSTLRWATSANHLFGNNVTSGETFTWLHSPVFRATPLDMKAEADIDFIMGENQLIFHGWPYSPSPDVLEPGDPGWSLYAAAVFNDHNPWHPVMPSVTKYIQRMSWLLRQGQPANQVALLLPTDDAWSSFAPSHVTVTGALQQLIRTDLMGAVLSAGYNVDFIDAETIERQGVGDHTILLLPPTDRIPAATLRKIKDYAAHGGKVIAVGKLPSLDAEGNPLPDRSLLAPIALVPGANALGQALHDAVAPDLRMTAADAVAQSQLGFIRRKLPEADVYYVVNTSNHTIDTELGFGTDHKSAEQWSTDTGLPTGAASSHQAVHLAPYESRVFVFSDTSDNLKRANEGADKTSVDLSSGWKVTFTGTGKSQTAAALTDWAADPATQHYSGEAVYANDFNLSSKPAGPVYLAVDGGSAIPGAPNSPPEHGTPFSVAGADGLPNPLVTRPGPGMKAWFDPPIREAALVYINGQSAGALWHPPYRLDVAKWLKAGTNHIEIHVYNTAFNAWSALKPRDYNPLIAKYGNRFQMQEIDQVKPLPSGILGRVHLVTENAK